MSWTSQGEKSIFTVWGVKIQQLLNSSKAVFSSGIDGGQAASALQSIAIPGWNWNLWTNKLERQFRDGWNHIHQTQAQLTSQNLCLNNYSKQDLFRPCLYTSLWCVWQFFLFSSFVKCQWAGDARCELILSDLSFRWTKQNPSPSVAVTLTSCVAGSDKSYR